MKPKAEKKEAAPKAAKKAKAADLKSLSGVGPAFEKKLIAIGVKTLEEMAGLTDAKIKKLEEKDSLSSLEQWHKWIEEAKSMI